MSCHAALFKPFIMLGSIGGIIPFATIDLISSASLVPAGQERSRRSLPRGSPPVRFSLMQIMYTGLWIVAPILSAVWLLNRMYEFALLQPGMGNLDGLVLGLGAFMTIGLACANALSVKPFSTGFINALANFDKTPSAVLLNDGSRGIYSLVQRIGWIISAQFAVAIPLSGSMMCVVILQRLNGELDFFISGDAFTDVVTVTASVWNYISPVFYVACFLTQSLMGARFTKIKLQALHKSLKKKLANIQTKNSYMTAPSWNARNPSSEENISLSKDAEMSTLSDWEQISERMTNSSTFGVKNGSQDFSMLSANLPRRAPALSTNVIGNGEVGAAASASAIMAEFRAELAKIEEESRTLSDILKTGELLGMTATVSYLIFSAYYACISAGDLLFGSQFCVESFILFADSMLLCCVGLSTLYVLCEEGFRLTEEVYKIVSTIRAPQGPDISQDDNILLEQVAQTLVTSPLTYDLGRFFCYDRSTFTMIVATVVTNLIVLVQFRSPSSDPAPLYVGASSPAVTPSASTLSTTIGT